MTIATNSQASLIEQQTLRLQQLKDDAQDIAQTLADQVWDRFENAIEEVYEKRYQQPDLSDLLRQRNSTRT